MIPKLFIFKLHLNLIRGSIVIKVTIQSLIDHVDDIEYLLYDVKRYIWREKNNSFNEENTKTKNYIKRRLKLWLS